MARREEQPATVPDELVDWFVAFIRGIEVDRA
jgi:hypothetical protein